MWVEGDLGGTGATGLVLHKKKERKWTLREKWAWTAKNGGGKLKDELQMECWAQFSRESRGGRFKGGWLGGKQEPNRNEKNY